jgi:DNA-directed RNA polymerase subunit K
VAEPLTAAVPSAAPQESMASTRVPSPPVDGEKYTRFERARILGARALQVSLGAPILIDIAATLVDPVDIAELEFAAGRIPITVRRAAVE